MSWGKGIGAFVEGFAATNAAMRARAKEEEDREYRRKRDEIQDQRYEQTDQRAAALHGAQLQHLGLQNQAIQSNLATAADAKAKADAVTGAVDQASAAGRAAREKSVLESVQPVSPSGTDEAGQPPRWKTVLDPHNTYDTRDLALQRAQAVAPTILAYINTDHVDKVREAALRANNPEFADKYATWIKTPQAQEGVRHFADAQAYAVVGAHEPALNSLVKSYNTKGYMNDGHRVERAGVTVDPKTGVTTYQLRFVDNASGQVVNKVSVRSDELHRLSGAFLAPDVVAKANYERVKADQDAERETKKAQAATEIKDRSAVGGNPYATGGYNENQGKAASFADRMADAEAIIGGNENINDGVLGWIGGVAQANLPEGLSNQVASDKRQQVTQAQRNFVNAVLRRESGAAISPDEFDSARKQYLAQPGDGAEVIAQKRRNRQIVIQGMMREAGPSYRPPSGWGDPKNPPQSASAATNGRSIGQYPASTALSSAPPGRGLPPDMAPGTVAPPAEGAPTARGLPPDMAPGGKAEAPASAQDALPGAVSTWMRPADFHIMDLLELQKNPAGRREAFNARYGTGAAARALGKPDMSAARQAPDGKWYVPDPARPGKYLEVVRP